MHSLVLFAGNSNLDLAREVVKCIGIRLGEAEVRTFSDGESQVEISENVRGKDVYVLQSTSAPTNHHMMELLLMIDAFKRSSAQRITAVMPYYGYARQDRKVAPRVPISAKLVADLLTVSGAGRLITIDLHAGQIQGFFNIPVDNLFATPVLLEHMKTSFSSNNMVVISPDAGGVERARAFAKRLNAQLAIIDKRREAANKAKAMNVIGDVDGKVAIILDDLVDTAGTLVQAAGALKDHGAIEVHACCTHAVLSGPAIERLESSDISSLVVTNTVPLKENAQQCGKIKVLSVARLIAEAIHRSHTGRSVSSLFV